MHASEDVPVWHAILSGIGLEALRTSPHINGARRPCQRRLQTNNSFDLEDLMNDRMFDSPVYVRDGSALVLEIAGLEDALDFLEEWPKNRRNLIYETALRACRRVYEGDFPLSAAREAFRGFAKAARILEEVDAPLPWMITGKGQGGGAIA